MNRKAALIFILALTASGWVHADDAALNSKQKEIDAFARNATDILEQSRAAQARGDNALHDTLIEKVRTLVPSSKGDLEPAKIPMDQMSYDDLLARDVWVRAEWRRKNTLSLEAPRYLTAKNNAAVQPVYAKEMSDLNDESRALEKQAAIVKTRNEKAAAEAPAKPAPPAAETKIRKVKNFAELEGKKLSLEGTNLLHLEGQDTDSGVAFTTQTSDGCSLIMDKVADFTTLHDLNIGDKSNKATQWTVGPAKAGDLVKIPTQSVKLTEEQRKDFDGKEAVNTPNFDPDAIRRRCQSVAIIFRSACIRSLMRAEAYVAPSSAVLKSDDGRTMTVYSRATDPDSGIYNCIERQAFAMPEVEDKSGAAVQLAKVPAGAAH